MERLQTHWHSNISKVKLNCRNRRQENTTSISEQQEKIHQLIAARTIEFQRKVKLLQEKVKEVKSNAKQTQNRLNSVHRYLD
ncbi:MAG TPA: hypothetical protein DDW65_20585 [Firmicutes bacterium]|jgi:hypothetical protein|nr:hypothetical protein [Bacillota bacterium]